MKSSKEKIAKKAEKLDTVFIRIEDIFETESQLFQALNGHMKRVRKILKEILEGTK